MMDRAEFHITRIDYIVIKHATESDEIIKKVFRSLVPEELRGKLVLIKERTKGYHGDEIIVYRYSLEGSEAENAFSYLLSRLEKNSIKYLLATLENRMERGRIIHLRVNKQFLTDNRYVLLDTDESVKIIVRLARRMDPKKVGHIIVDMVGDKEGR
jgi:RNA binding exosome subunit